MNKGIKSPLKHKEGNALEHGMYADEAAWHAKNPDVAISDKTGNVMIDATLENIKKDREKQKKEKKRHSF